MTQSRLCKYEIKKYEIRRYKHTSIIDTSRMRWRGLCVAVILAAGAGAASAGANATSAGANASAAASARPAVWALDRAALAAAGCSDAVCASVALCEARAVNTMWPVAGRGPDDEWCQMVHASAHCWPPCFCAPNASIASNFSNFSSFSGLAWAQARLAATAPQCEPLARCGTPEARPEAPRPVLAAGASRVARARSSAAVAASLFVTTLLFVSI